MYRFILTDQTKQDLANIYKSAVAVHNKLERLASSPLQAAKQTNVPIIGNYYMNAGRYCILFDVNEEARTVDLLAVMLSAKLDKILKGKISA